MDADETWISRHPEIGKWEILLQYDDRSFQSFGGSS